MPAADYSAATKRQWEHVKATLPPPRWVRRDALLSRAALREAGRIEHDSGDCGRLAIGSDDARRVVEAALAVAEENT